MLEIPHAKGHRDGVESVISKRQGCGIAPLQFDLFFKALLRNFGSANLQHLFGDVRPDDVRLRIAFCQGDGQIRRARGEVEDGFRLAFGNDFGSSPPPHLIYIKGK